ncbi:hypothetical protein LRS13_02835 [Svornostia abyssi]|uniref:Uncharacterized protein n=1 Tax=Svornostia abyssi TaxID=2898438 RepID=A0ABY5PIM5_9ACTN|nr:hypothetical protein LRS13_02835 [Parviterribacteraceae bacterium J379]
MSEPSLPEKVVAVHDACGGAALGHAFGGALALAYYAEPRATIDIDLNVFVAAERHAEVADALTPLGVEMTGDVAALVRDGQCRWRWGRTPLDLFFAYDPFHDAMRAGARTVPFAQTTIPVLAPEHLTVCKAVFNRPKDWLDIEQIIIGADALDAAEVRDWMRRIVGADDERAARLDGLLEACR